MAIQRVGWRSYSPVTSPVVSASTLLTSLYSAWDGEASGAPLDTSIYGVWNGNDNTNDSVGSNNGTGVGGLTYTTGKIGNAFTFNGTNAYVSFPTNSWNSLVGTDLTISLWVKLTSTANQTLISNMSTPSANVWNGWEIRVVSGQPNFYSWNNSGSSQGVVGSTLTTNIWYNIIATKSGNSYKIYVNGSLIASSTGTGNAIVSGTFYPNIGHLQYTSSFHWFYTTNGSAIDGVNLWSRKLSDDEITQLYNSGNGVQYPFSGQTLPSANNQFAIDNGTLMNGCNITDGKVGKAFLFDGVNDFVLLPTNAMRFTGDFSYSFFVSLGSISGDQTILSCENYLSNENGDRGYLIFFSNGVLKFNGYYNSSVIFAGLSTTTITTNTWYHFVVTKTASQVKIYMNGSLQTTTNFTGTLAYNSVVYPSIGVTYKQNNVNNANYFYISAGSKIDALNAWSKALTQTEITELYNSGNGKQLTTTPIVTNGLVLNLDASRTSSYPNTGTTWYDISGNANNATFPGGTSNPVFGTASGGVITFDGVNDYINMGNQSAITPSSGNFTYEFWVNPQSLSAQVVPILTTTITNGLWIGKLNSNFVLRSYNVADDIQFSLPTIGTWTNIVVAKSNGIVKIYYNNLLIASASNTKTYASSTTEIGRDGTTNVFFGSMASVRYYNRGLSDSEITQNFNATKSRFGL